MRLVRTLVVATAAAVVAAGTGAAFQMDPDRVVPGGGVHVSGWQGQIPDAGNAGKVEHSKLSGTPAALVINSGPPMIYWNPANTASGNYTVKATFTEPKLKSASSHSHPYGIFIGGNKLGTPQATLLYCVAYGERNRYKISGFGPAAFNLLPGRGGAGTNPAVAAAAADGSVKQEIAMSVRDGNVSCSINGTEVNTFPRAEVVGAGKLESTDGIYGIRVSHNIDVNVAGLSKN
jgi:hypothetical protein